MSTAEQTRPVWVKGPPTKNGIYWLKAAIGCTPFISVVENYKSYGNTYHHSFICDIPPAPVDPLPQVPTPRGENEHFHRNKNHDVWCCRPVSDDMCGWVIDHVARTPAHRRTIARLASSYWPEDRAEWFQWAGIEGGGE